MFIPLEKIVRSFRVIFQRGHDQLMDILLMGWWWGKQESSSSTFRSNWSRACMLVGSMPPLTVSFPHLEGGFHICKIAQRYCVYLWGNKTLVQGCSWLFFFFGIDKKMPCLGISSVQFSRSVMSDSLQPHGLQHSRLPCPSPAPRAYSNSYPWSQWCHPSISSSAVPFSSFPNSQLVESAHWSSGKVLVAEWRLFPVIK